MRSLELLEKFFFIWTATNVDLRVETGPFMVVVMKHQRDSFSWAAVPHKLINLYIIILNQKLLYCKCSQDGDYIELSTTFFIKLKS